MLYLTLLTIGDVPKGPFSAISSDFLERLRTFVKLEHRVIKQTQNVDKYLTNNTYTLLLSAEGKTYTSESFATLLQSFEGTGTHLTVLLGGPKGFDEAIKKRANLVVSLSPMTTTHDLAHLFFLEQLYRAMTINHGKEYHY